MSSFHRAGGSGGGANHYSTASCTAATNGTDSIMGKTGAPHHEGWQPPSSRELYCWLWLLCQMLTALVAKASIELRGRSLTQLQWDALNDLKSDAGLINRAAYCASQSCDFRLQTWTWLSVATWLMTWTWLWVTWPSAPLKLDFLQIKIHKVSNAAGCHWDSTVDFLSELCFLVS